MTAKPALVTALVGSVVSLLAARALAQESSDPSARPQENTTEADAGTTVDAAEPTPSTVPSAAQTPTHGDSVEGSLHRGLSFGLRSGYALRFADGDEPHFGSAVPLGLDAGFRITRHVYFGLTGEYAQGLTADCGATCSRWGRILRFGFDTQYHFARQAKFGAWLGFGAVFVHETRIEVQDEASGYAGIRQTRRRELTTGSFEFVNVQVGGDFKIGRSLRTGPMMSLNLSYSVPDVQGWVMFGARGQYDL